MSKDIELYRKISLVNETEIHNIYHEGEKVLEMTVDRMTRHKWPEEKPKESGEYLICEQQFKSIYVAWYNDEAFYEHIGGDSYELDVLYWWNLPEVKE